MGPLCPGKWKPSLNTIFLSAAKKKTENIEEEESEFEGNPEIEAYNTDSGLWPSSIYGE